MSQIPLSSVRLGIVCPMANEIDTAKAFVEAVLANCVGFDSVTFFAVFDRASQDGTLDILTQLAATDKRVCVVWDAHSRCVVDAYVRGYQEAIDTQCDWILEIDAGFSHNPADIPKFFDKMQQGYDCVFGSRFCRGGKIIDSSLKRKFISWGGTLATNLLLGTKLSDMTSGFELFTRPALEAVLNNGIRSRGHFFQTEIRVFCHHFRIAEVPICYRSASPSVNNSVIKDAFSNLWRMTRKRFAGTLWNSRISLPSQQLWMQKSP